MIGSKHIRFYAGCQLRTQDGYNIGTLSIMDDTPRSEFNPRQRHTLKEFAVCSRYSDMSAVYVEHRAYTANHNEGTRAVERQDPA